jgi:hypothetical protein
VKNLPSEKLVGRQLTIITVPRPFHGTVKDVATAWIELYEPGWNHTWRIDWDSVVAYREVYS